MAVKDMLNKKCGKLTVIARDTSKIGGAAYWICQCECGNQKSIRGQFLRDGSVVDCGCMKSQRTQKRIDTTSLVNKKFGSLLVLERDMTKPHGHQKEPYWICKCDCGTIISVLGRSLKNGHTQSCGCLRKEKNANRCTLDLTNKKFGYLTAIEKTNKQTHGSYIWKCLCDCGNTYYTTATILNTGACSSCGCRVRSKGEEAIEKLLVSANILFETEFTFDDCRNPKTGYKYRYDFALMNDKKEIIKLIEFDGEQHFKSNSFFRNTLDTINFNDTQKNQYAKQHNIPLVRIPYTALKTLTLEDIIGDKYLI